MTAKNARQGFVSASHKSMAYHRLNGILGTARPEAAMVRQQAAHIALIQGDAVDKQLL
jgi:hypothetical protein